MVILLSTVSAKHHRAVSVVVLGLAGFIDPLRPEVRDAVAVSRQAGVKVILIIGNRRSPSSSGLFCAMAAVIMAVMEIYKRVRRVEAIG